MPKRRPRRIPEELPLCDGPKLRLFEHHKSRIEWLERLGDSENGDSPTEGYVFRAKIKGREYAVKVFKFYDPMVNEVFWGPLLGRDTPLDVVACYTDPFYAECRAYGRIERKKKLKSHSTPCHGFLFLQSRDEKILYDRNIDLALDDVDLEYQQSTVGGCRPRAIVKDLASSDSGVTEGNLSRLLRGIATLNKEGIYNMDIRLANYKDGKLVDFGSSWTEPHRLLDALDRREAIDTKLTDRVLFDQMVDEMVEDKEIPESKRVSAMHSMKLRSYHA